MVRGRVCLRFQSSVRCRRVGWIRPRCGLDVGDGSPAPRRCRKGDLDVCVGLTNAKWLARAAEVLMSMLRWGVDIDPAR